MITKQKLANWLQRSRLLRWGLYLGVRLLIPRHYVGAVGAVFNDAGQVLLVKHVFRPTYAWGLPGGWVERGENPAEAVRRELEEELNLLIEVRQLLLCETQGSTGLLTASPGLGLVYYCRLATNRSLPMDSGQAPHAYEVLEIEWAEPLALTRKMHPLHRRAIELGKKAFDLEQNNRKIDT